MFIFSIEKKCHLSHYFSSWVEDISPKLQILQSYAHDDASVLGDFQKKSCWQADLYINYMNDIFFFCIILHYKTSFPYGKKKSRTFDVRRTSFHMTMWIKSEDALQHELSMKLIWFTWDRKWKVNEACEKVISKKRNRAHRKSRTKLKANESFRNYFWN